MLKLKKIKFVLLRDVDIEKILASKVSAYIKKEFHSLCTINNFENQNKISL